MKVLHIFNRGNLPYYIVKGLRQNGIEADLLLAKDESVVGSTSNPEWESNTNHEPWIIHWGGDSLHPFRNKKDLLKLILLARKYNIIHCHHPASIFAQFLGKPFLVHETGWIRIIPYRNNIADKLIKRSFNHADCVIMTNPDCYELLKELKYKKQEFLPFAIDTDFYIKNGVKEDSKLFFHPNRIHFEYKGTDKLIKAFSIFIKDNPEYKLLLVRFGVDYEKALELINKLGIINNIEWLEYSDKPTLLKYYSKACAIFDQFNVGSYGSVGTEAMSCSRPLVIHLNGYFDKVFKEKCPHIEANNVEQIANAMNLLKDETLRETMGKQSREFAIKHHSLKSTTKQLIDIYGSIVNE